MRTQRGLAHHRRSSEHIQTLDSAQLFSPSAIYYPFQPLMLCSLFELFNLVQVNKINKTRKFEITSGKSQVN